MILFTFPKKEKRDYHLCLHNKIYERSYKNMSEEVKKLLEKYKIVELTVDGKTICSNTAQSNSVSK